jgi:hypothetical protein
MEVKTLKTTAICLSILSLACLALALPAAGQDGVPGARPADYGYASSDAGSGSLQPVSNSPLVTLDVKDANAIQVINALFKGRAVNYAIDPAIGKPPYSDMKLMFSISGVPFEVALKSLCRVAGLVYRLENGVYLIAPKPQAFVPYQTADLTRKGGSTAPQPGPGGTVETGCPSATIQLPSAEALDQIPGLNLTTDQKTKVCAILAKAEAGVAPLRDNARQANKTLRDGLFGNLSQDRIDQLLSDAEKADMAVAEAEYAAWTEIRSTIPAQQFAAFSNFSANPGGTRGR